MNYLIRCIKYARGVRFLASLIVRCGTCISLCIYFITSITNNLVCSGSFQHDANAVICDSDLSTQLRSAAYTALKKMAGEIQDEIPALMSGAGHDAMAMSHLTKVCCSLCFIQCFLGSNNQC
jgi:hypothetical protein